MRKSLSTAVMCIVLTVLGTLVFFACRRTSDFYPSTADGPLSVTSAKKYYKEFIKTAGRIVPEKFSENGSGSAANQRGSTDTTSSLPNKKYIMWKKAYTSQTDQFSFVEAPLYYNQKISALITKYGEQVDVETAQKIFAASLNRLIVFKDKKSGVISQYIVNYIPDISYLEKHNYDISHNQINKLDKDFTGFIKYTTWDGEPMAVFKLKDGKTISRGLYKKEILHSSNGKTFRNFSNSAAAREVCDYYTEWIWEQECWVADPETGNVACTGHYIPVSYEECYDDGTDDGGDDDYPTDPCLDPANFYLPECGYEDPGDDPNNCDGCPNDNEPPPVPGDPCSDGATGASTATSVSKSAAYSGAMNSIQSAFNSDGNEHGISFGRDANGNIITSSMSNGGDHSGTVGNVSGRFADAHNHPSGFPPSSGDFYGFVDLANSNSQNNYNTRYVVTNTGEVYALILTDLTLANQFIKDHPLVPNTGYSPSYPEEIVDEIDKLRGWYGLSEANALAYMFEDKNAGVVLAKQDNNGDFKVLNTDVTQDANGNTSYAPNNCK